jgi:hypothetical protein
MCLGNAREECPDTETTLCFALGPVEACISGYGNSAQIKSTTLAAVITVVRSPRSMIERGSSEKRTNCFNKGVPRAKITYVNSLRASWFLLSGPSKRGYP